MKIIAPPAGMALGAVLAAPLAHPPSPHVLPAQPPGGWDTDLEFR